MLIRVKVPQPGQLPDRHVVALFPFSLDKKQPHEHSRTRSPKLYTAKTRCLAQAKCLERHFEEQIHTLVMTTFRFDLRHANFANIQREKFFKNFWTFTQPIDVFNYQLVNGVMMITLCGGTNFVTYLLYSHSDDILTNHYNNTT